MAKSSKIDFTFMNKQQGMFSYSGLTKEQVAQLRKEYAIYMPGSGELFINTGQPWTIVFIVMNTSDIVPSREIIV